MKLPFIQFVLNQLWHFLQTEWLREVQLFPKSILEALITFFTGLLLEGCSNQLANEQFNKIHYLYTISDLRRYIFRKILKMSKWAIIPIFTLDIL